VTWGKGRRRGSIAYRPPTPIRVIAGVGTHWCRMIDRRCGHAWNSWKAQAAFRAISCSFVTTSGLTRTISSAIFRLLRISRHFRPSRQFCKHFRFWNSVSGPSLRTGNRTPTMLSQCHHLFWPSNGIQRHFHATLLLPSPKWRLKLILVPVLTANFDFSHPVSS